MNYLSAKIFLLFLISGCNMQSDKNNFFRPNWQGLILENFSLKFGEEVNLKDENIRAIVLDFSEDEDGKWYGVCFLNKGRLFGRQIPNGFSGNCIDLFDMTYLHESLIDSIETIRSHEIDINKVGIGSSSPVNNREDIIRDFDLGLVQREKIQTPCSERIADLDRVNECYFPIEKILL